MPRRGELATPELKQMPSLSEWKRVARRYPGGVTIEAGVSARVFAACFGMMQPGDMTIIGLPRDRKDKLLVLSREIKACHAQLHTLMSSYKRLLDKGPWAMHRRDLFRDGIAPIQAYDSALDNHYRRVEYLTIKAARLKEYRDVLEDEMIEERMQFDAVEGV